jgi:hypothetical protein
MEKKRTLAELALEAEAERMAQKWYLQEQERMRMQREKELTMKREKEAEDAMRKEKAEKSRLETQRILAEQEAAVEARRREMDARDRLRAKKEEQKQKEIALINAEKRAQAEERRQKTAEQNVAKLLARRAEFAKKEAEAEARRQELEFIRLAEEAAKQKREAERAADQARKFQMAKKIEQDRINSILAKAAEKEELLAQARFVAEKERTKKMIEMKLMQSHKREVVKEHERAQAWHREQTLLKIMDDTERAFAIKAAKDEIQQQRRMGNLEASMQRHKIQQKMEQVAIKGINLENADAVESITQSLYAA